ncbi:S-layer family protein [Moorena bouillonii]|uniref:S-layer family protein n=1 Tax=Moorena bouillonii PNG TaxID=568701 RepID=A0A1U7N3H3_9CYAN|nr:S-layer family protein [Moorena bouillonii]OLT60499.1 hypothetical protein BJP37_17260 [Moorena bouillonii PNG]
MTGSIEVTTINTSNKVENAGDVIIDSGKDIMLIGTNSFTDDQGLIFANTSGSGQGGQIKLVANQEILLSDRFLVTSDTTSDTKGSGNGGEITIEAESVTVRDGAVVGTLTSGEGDAGSVSIKTQKLLVEDGAQITANTLGKGNAGNVTINSSESVKVIGIGVSGEDRFVSLISTRANSDSTGKGGDLTINTQSLLVEDGAQVSASTFGKGDAGSLTINAKESVRLIGKSADGNFASGIFAQTNPDSTGDGGDLEITTPLLLLLDGGQVSVSSFGEGDGGSLTISAKELVLDGGQVSFNTFLTFLPDNQIDTTTLLSSSCIFRSREQPGSFIITGSGGLPTAPGSGKISRFATGTVRTIPTDGSSSLSTQPDRPWQIGDPIIEPQKVYRLADGRLVLSRECVE